MGRWQIDLVNYNSIFSNGMPPLPLKSEQQVCVGAKRHHSDTSLGRRDREFLYHTADKLKKALEISSTILLDTSGRFDDKPQVQFCVASFKRTKSITSSAECSYLKCK